MKEFTGALFIATVSGIIAELVSHYVEGWIKRIRDRRRRNKKSAHKKLRPQ